VYDELLMQPLQIRRYWLGMMGNGEPYGGGGMRLLPRDFMKFGQLVLNGGTWNRKRVLSEAWVERATSPLVMLDGRFKYGYLWWIDDFKYQERTITGYRAGGNGGQVVVAIPELDMVVTFLGGNYNDRVMYYTLRTLLPERILPAVMAK
jgi:CubicO group peptidase (beta-lactamase class C family)